MIPPDIEILQELPDFRALLRDEKELGMESLDRFCLDSTHRCRAVQRKKNACVYRHAVESRRCSFTHPLKGILDPKLR